jgi:hypothetical protein
MNRSLNDGDGADSTVSTVDVGRNGTGTIEKIWNDGGRNVELVDRVN